MKSSVLRYLIAFVMFFALVGTCLAGPTKTIPIQANVPVIAGGLNVNVSKIGANSDVWLESSPNLPIDFGTLVYEPINGEFYAPYYYAVDVGVTDNTGNNWLLTHNSNSVLCLQNASHNLDNNITVSFVKQTFAEGDTVLQKYSYSNSNNVSYNMSQLAGGWLRVYYGVGTGGSHEETGVLPVTIDKPSGQYSGSVVLTLTP